MGLSDAGRFAVVTNIRDANGPDTNKASRGALVADWLADAVIPQAADTFNPFNLIVTDLRSARFISNRPGPTQEMLAEGIHGMSNALPNEHWPRKERLVAQMADWLAGEALQPEILLDMLIEDKARDRDAHPVFIRSPVYGTRCSTLVAVNAEGQGQIIERRFDADGSCSGETVLHFIWPQ